MEAVHIDIYIKIVYNIHMKQIDNLPTSGEHNKELIETQATSPIHKQRLWTRLALIGSVLFGTAAAGCSTDATDPKKADHQDLQGVQRRDLDMQEDRLDALSEKLGMDVEPLQEPDAPWVKNYVRKREGDSEERKRNTEERTEQIEQRSQIYEEPFKIIPRTRKGYKKAG